MEVNTIGRKGIFESHIDMIFVPLHIREKEPLVKDSWSSLAVELYAKDNPRPLPQPWEVKHWVDTLGVHLSCQMHGR